MCACPKCGYEPNSTEWNYSEWRITTNYGSVTLKSQLQAKIFDLLWRKQGIKGLTRQRIVDIVYADDINGGPESLTSLTRVLHNIRFLIASVGILLDRGYSGGEGYNLIFTNPFVIKKKKYKDRREYHKKYYKRKTDNLEPIWMTKMKERV